MNIKPKAMTDMERLESEARFIQRVNLLAEMYGCTCRIDIGKHIAYFDGDPKQCELLAAKLCEIFKDEEVE